MKTNLHINIQPVDWPYGIMNAIIFLQNCIFYEDTFSLLFNTTNLEDEMSMYSKKNALRFESSENTEFHEDMEFNEDEDSEFLKNLELNDTFEPAEQHIYKIQYIIYTQTFKFQYLSYIEIIQSALCYFLHRYLTESTARSLLVYAFEKLIPVICHVRFSKITLEVLNRYSIPNLLRIECALAAVNYFHEKPWDDYNFNRKFSSITYLQSEGLYYFLYPFICNNNNKEFLARLQISDTFKIKTYIHDDEFFLSLNGNEFYGIRKILAKFEIFEANLNYCEDFTFRQPYTEIIELCKSQKSFKPFKEKIEEKVNLSTPGNYGTYIDYGFDVYPYVYETILLLLEHDKRFLYE